MSRELEWNDKIRETQVKEWTNTCKQTNKCPVVQTSGSLGSPVVGIEWYRFQTAQNICLALWSLRLMLYMNICISFVFKIAQSTIH